MLRLWIGRIACGNSPHSHASQTQSPEGHLEKVAHTRRSRDPRESLGGERLKLDDEPLAHGLTLGSPQVQRVQKVHFLPILLSPARALKG